MFTKLFSFPMAYALPGKDFSGQELDRYFKVQDDLRFLQGLVEKDDRVTLSVKLDIDGDTQMYHTYSMDRGFGREHGMIPLPRNEWGLITATLEKVVEGNFMWPPNISADPEYQARYDAHKKEEKRLTQAAKDATKSIVYTFVQARGVPDCFPRDPTDNTRIEVFRHMHPLLVEKGLELGWRSTAAYVVTEKGKLPCVFDPEKEY